MDEYATLEDLRSCEEITRRDFEEKIVDLQEEIENLRSTLRVMRMEISDLELRAFKLERK